MLNCGDPKLLSLDPCTPVDPKQYSGPTYLGKTLWKNERPVTESFVEAISMILFEDKPTTVGG